MMRKLLASAILVAVFGSGFDLYAQFNTVRDRRGESFELIKREESQKQSVEKEKDSIKTIDVCIPKVTRVDSVAKLEKSPSKEPVRKKHLALFQTYEGLPGLTINSLLEEIRKCGIKHEKVVLAQAILETGWFTSNVCRTKNNLFGLTNPRTGQYYEFEHWTESVKAYYTKVQYRYKGGNYLMWLDEIGYAEKKTYVQLLIKLLNQYFV